MQNPKQDNYISWEEALFIAKAEIYKAEKQGKKIKGKELNKYPSIVKSAIKYCYYTGEIY